MAKPILCVDFDGVIHAYTTPWSNAETISDGPVHGALPWLLACLEHFDVRIYSSRSKSMEAVSAMKAWLTKWAQAEGLNEWDFIPVGFAAEKPAAFLTIDDRAIMFEGRFDYLSPAELLRFKPWNK